MHLLCKQVDAGALPADSTILFSFRCLTRMRKNGCCAVVQRGWLTNAAANAAQPRTSRLNTIIRDTATASGCGFQTNGGPRNLRASGSGALNITRCACVSGAKEKFRSRTELHAVTPGAVAVLPVKRRDLNIRKLFTGL